MNDKRYAGLPARSLNLSRPFGRTGEQRASLRGFLIKFILGSSLLLGSTLFAQGNPDVLVVLPVIVGDGNGDGNQLPTAVNDSYETSEGTRLVVDAVSGVLANDSDPELEPLQAMLVSDVANGVLNAPDESI